jgi:hypothetical protein
VKSFLAAVLLTAVVTIGYFGAPVLPVALGAGLACAWWQWKARRRPTNGASVLRPGS